MPAVVKNIGHDVAYTFPPSPGPREFESKSRQVTATNRDLGRIVELGLLHNGLLLGLRSFLVDLLPLLEHPADIRDLWPCTTWPISVNATV